ncbi:hypothetical protein EPUS_04077 [Endocarpon pusillum Z07020]|uniref:Uncharacterized protein n=1 Tax=Endocarpon pusillum (strain Z07020 / HMAS-L-300199) TaxID=1263415 RepID=U1HVQ6_ENDPU|nr:uncharacterized protein EPUS_04077 [Endocarpon pusillum Z07020]ERF73454.1 hypothetical protein EPUS_04077 [Endocarpon pusillum Z07020]
MSFVTPDYKSPTHIRSRMVLDRVSCTRIIPRNFSKHISTATLHPTTTAAITHPAILKTKDSPPTNTTKMCKYCFHHILTATDISDLTKAYQTAQRVYPDRTLAQQLAVIAREFQEVYEMTRGTKSKIGRGSAVAGLPQNWDWRKLGQILKEHGLPLELPHFKGL